MDASIDLSSWKGISRISKSISLSLKVFTSLRVRVKTFRDNHSPSATYPPVIDSLGQYSSPWQWSSRTRSSWFALILETLPALVHWFEVRWLSLCPFMWSTRPITHESFHPRRFFPRVASTLQESLVSRSGLGVNLGWNSRGIVPIMWLLLSCSQQPLTLDGGERISRSDEYEEK